MVQNFVVELKFADMVDMFGTLLYIVAKEIVIIFNATMEMYNENN
jgi:hypothetical protein